MLPLPFKFELRSVGVCISYLRDDNLFTKQSLHYQLNNLRPFSISPVRLSRSIQYPQLEQEKKGSTIQAPVADQFIWNRIAAAGDFWKGIEDIVAVVGLIQQGDLESGHCSLPSGSRARRTTAASVSSSIVGDVFCAPLWRTWRSRSKIHNSYGHAQCFRENCGVHVLVSNWENFACAKLFQRHKLQTWKLETDQV